MTKNIIKNIDCVIGLSELESESVDLVITSPPYNLGNDHHTDKKRHNPYDDNMPEQEYQKWQIDVLNECHRVLKPSGSMFYNHKNRIKKGVQISPYEWLFKTNFIIKQELVWWNGSPNFDKIRFYPQTERVYWLAKSPETKLVNTISHHDIFKVDEWKKQGTNKSHTRAFPVEMCEDIISCFPDAKVVLDPFSGSGTTAVATVRKGLSYIAFEKIKEYYDLSVQRLLDEDKNNEILR